MTKDQVYEIWRPAQSPWSRWVKPVLFSFLRDPDLGSSNPSVPEWNVPFATDTAIVVDMPGAEGVLAGVKLCRRGYQPIPIYNASPFATYDPYADEVVTSIINARWPSAFAVVDMFPIMSALCGAAPVLTTANLPPSAPPAFLLNSKRRGLTDKPEEGWFDNRSFVANTDFPSADFFKRHGISKVVLVQEESKIRPDLLEVLLAWQHDGMKIARQEPWQEWEPLFGAVKKLPLIFALWQRYRRAFSYRRDLDGAFGKLVPPASS